MAPRKGETDEQKINRMYMNASAAISRAQFKQVVAALKEHPRHIPAVHRQLATLGALGAAASTAAKSAKESPAKLALCDDDGDDADMGPQTKQGDTDASPAPGGSTGSDQKPALVFDRNTSRVEHLSPTHLEVALSLVEPASMSRANLKRIVKRGCRDHNRKVILRYWEYLTGEGPAMPLAKGGDKSWGAFIENAKLLNEARGRRLSDAVLPIDWYEQGLYNFNIVSDGELELTKKTADGVLKRSFLVPKGALEFSIEQNWSDNGAVLAQLNGPLMQPLGILFAQEPSSSLAAPNAARRPSAGPNIRINSTRPASAATSSSRAGAKHRRTGCGDTVNFSIDPSTLQQVIDSAGLQLNFAPEFRTT